MVSPGLFVASPGRLVVSPVPFVVSPGPFVVSPGRFVVSPVEPPVRMNQVPLFKTLTDAHPSTELRTNGMLIIKQKK